MLLSGYRTNKNDDETHKYDGRHNGHDSGQKNDHGPEHDHGRGHDHGRDRDARRNRDADNTLHEIQHEHSKSKIGQS